MSELREAAQQALESLENCRIEYDYHGNPMDEENANLLKAVAALRAAIAQPEQLVVGGDDLPTLTKWTPMPEYAAKSAAVPGRAEALKQAGYTRRARQLPEEDEQEPYTDDVTRIMREAGVTFHLGLPHKAVVEQMSRVVDLVYAEASIKAAQQFATAPPQRKPLTDEEMRECAQAMDAEPLAEGWSELIKFARAIEQAHGIGGES